jgi:iron complex outermembrane receptor protein
MCMRAVSLVTMLVIYIPTIAAGSEVAAHDLKELVGTKIYTVSKKEEDSFSSPSAVYVITEDDLKQMGVRHVADALRAVPGLQVAKITSNKWMVAVRGFGEQFSNKLLVLVDDRPVYTTIFSGVLWNQEDVPIQDIKQIEVIRGPGATLWGSNAVNGVINIITKSTQNTIGGAQTLSTGFTDWGENQIVSETSYGKKIQDWGTTRATMKLRNDPSYSAVSHNTAYDDRWKSGSLNLRYDSPPDPNQSIKMTGSVFKDIAEQTYTFPTLMSPYSYKQQGNESSRGGHIQGELTKALDSTRSVTLRSYLDYTDWHYAGYQTNYTDYSLEGQYNAFIFSDWELSSGLGYKLTYDEAQSTNLSILNPDSSVAHYGDIFAQVKIPLEDTVSAAFGSKLESNSYNPISLSPDARLTWQPTHSFMAWTAWSNSVRIPSRNTYDLTTYLAGTPGGYVALIPSEDFKPEKLESYETGIRANIIHGLQLDASVFYNNYHDLRTFIPGPALGNPIAVPLYISNKGEANTKGFEIAGTYQTSPRLRLNLSYAHHDLDFSAPAGTNDAVFLNSGEKWAKDAWTVRTAYLLSEGIKFNTSSYYYSAQPAIKIPAYVKIDSNISFDVFDNASIVVGVDNVTDDRHPEYSGPLFGEAIEVPRLTYVTLRLGL